MLSYAWRHGVEGHGDLEAKGGGHTCGDRADTTKETIGYLGGPSQPSQSLILLLDLLHLGLEVCQAGCILHLLNGW